MITKCCFDTKAKAFNIHLKDNKPYSSLSGDSLKALGVPIPYIVEDFSYHAHDNVNVSFARAEATVNEVFFYGSRLEVDMSATIDNFQIKAYYEHLSKLISDEPELKFEHKRLAFHFRRKWTEVGSFRIPTTLNLYGPLYIDLYSKVVTTERDGQTDYTFHISGHVRGTGLTGRLDESQGRLVPVMDWLNGTLADAAVC
ncbi:hypothetical protein ASPWEDRAFT_180291 [Aspergillus wentii DTO 134E9]|uniref:Uncharacterized protein n=1 Tax=Aspergillus wentii DTO 134E9 TaxID=1073089 RepID=A0A1L9RV45_ASPWE|nr:uncharacterized protein ASPWEDRAFT_180291 [Aspergillus wentii DTO 134E9]KAI9928718.1 hypothetical protein MW887_001935 [Aspergillus wentii]OJJ38811.1 hypothetical protein ASPWEDRAFT_180291 [Aspergillus wentii DTO 134E9]